MRDEGMHEKWICRSIHSDGVWMTVSRMMRSALD